MTQPSVADYLEASSFAYNSGMSSETAPELPVAFPAGFSGDFQVDTNHYQSKNGYDAFDPKTGFYGAAYTLGSGSDKSIVISYEGTNLDAFKTNPLFAYNELKADVALYYGKLPSALTEAATFAENVISTAKSEGISPDNIHITGHSLGAAEAEYADAETQVVGDKAKLVGATFGTPGIPSQFIPSGITSGLTNYAEYGDPVGNYAYTGPNSPEGSFIYNDSIKHFGVTDYLGSEYDAIPLRLAGALYSSKRPGAKKAALVALLGAAYEYHPLSVYAASLDHTLIDPPAGATALAGVNISSILHGTAFGLATGAHTVEVKAAGQTLTSQFYDTFVNQAAADTTFVFDPGFGHDTIKNLLYGGPNHDTVALPSADFASFSQVLHDTQNTPNGAVIHDNTSGDTILLAGVTKAELAHHKADVSFHA